MWAGPTAAVLLYLESKLEKINDNTLIVEKKWVLSHFNSVILGANHSVNWEEFSLGSIFHNPFPHLWRSVIKVINLVLFHNIFIFFPDYARKFNKSFFSDYYFYLLIFMTSTDHGHGEEENARNFYFKCRVHWMRHSFWNVLLPLLPHQTASLLGKDYLVTADCNISPIYIIMPLSKPLFSCKNRPEFYRNEPYLLLTALPSLFHIKL